MRYFIRTVAVLTPFLVTRVFNYCHSFYVRGIPKWKSIGTLTIIAYHPYTVRRRSIKLLRNYSRHTLQVNTVCGMGTFLPILFETPFKVDQLPKASGALLITNLYCAAYHIIGL